MWNSSACPMIMEQQDGRSGIEDGIDVAAQGKAVGGEQYPVGRCLANVVGETAKRWGYGRFDGKQGRPISAATLESSFQSLQHPLFKVLLQDVGTSYPAVLSIGPGGEVSLYAIGIMRSLGQGK